MDAVKNNANVDVFISRENSNSLFEHVEFIDLTGIKMLCQLTT